MLGSFGSSREEAEDHSASHHHQIQQLPPGGFPSAATHMRQLLISCAELISRSDFAAAHRLYAFLSDNNSSPYGDSTERLVHQFTKALSLRLANTVPATSNIPFPTPNVTLLESDENFLHSSYLTLNQVTPFIRFGHLTANQAILEAVEGRPAVHILDFNVMHGVQWPPLMQAMAERYPPPTLRITGTGHDADLLRRTGNHLSKFALSLGLRFHFHPLLLSPDDDDPAAAVPLLPDETLAVNLELYLHKLLKDRDKTRLFLLKIKAMNPRVVTVVEREANHNHPIFLQRFIEAVDHYTAVFDSLEATLPPASRERMVVERLWFGREIADIVAAEGDNRRERHERFRSWEMMLRSSGFCNVPLSPFALSQAKLLLRLHYPSEGYQLHILNASFFLGWQNHFLFSVSSWR
ncbi:scarecrow-like protein 18 [Actinidia eriantha]|uniref:scarecrow-like protein 18 n=1 Tax=Actinidia eriantha TaxID=165200 RepID=UPI002589EEC6|nr:scarecrow-like protein 18 [Actinidia eriantha]